jgi:hypothetical protein
MKPINSDSKRLEHDHIWIFMGILFLAITILAKTLLIGSAIIYAFLLLALIAIIGFLIGFRRRKKY